MRVAFATEDGVTVNEHFGRAFRFDIYDIRPESVQVLEQREIGLEAAGDRIDERVALIRDCRMLFINEIGAAAAARVTNARVHPVKVPAGKPMAELVAELQKTLAHSPPPWLRRLLNEEAP